MTEKRQSLEDWLSALSGRVSLLFMDVVESTALLYRTETIQYTRMLRSYRQRAVDLAYAHNGRMIDESGDGLLAAFPTARGAFQVATEMHRDPGDASLRLRLGVHHGTVRADGDALMGRNIHLAARVVQRAIGPELWVSDALKERLELESPESASEIVWLTDEVCELKGIPEAKRLWRAR